MPRDINLDSAEAYCQKGMQYGLCGQYDKAIAAYQKAVSINPNFAEAYHRMGFTYECLEQYPNALVAYVKAIGVDPDYADAYYGMGSAYENLGQDADALSAYKKAVALKPDDADAYFRVAGSPVRKCLSMPSPTERLVCFLYPVRSEVWLELRFPLRPPQPWLSVCFCLL